VQFIDMDDVIVKTEGTSINEIFSRTGEPFFRDLETQVLQKIAEKNSIVVSTGGGCIEREMNRSLMSQSGMVFFIDTPWEDIQERLEKSSERPLASVEDGWQKILDLYEKRYPLYCNADYIIKAGNKEPAEVAREITELVNR
jgi:shikimate kinase